MIVRPSSFIREYDDFYTGDPAIVQLADAASDEDQKSHRRRIEVARETGNWTDVLVPGMEPTKFTMKPLSGEVHRRLLDMVPDKVGLIEVHALAFRCAIMSVSNFGGLEFKREQTQKLGTMAASSVVDALDAVDMGIVTQLGAEALRRAREVSPKS